MGKGSNGQMDFKRTGLVKVGDPMSAESCGRMDVIHGSQDDAAPWKFNGTFIGANHGWYGVMDLTVISHGLSSSDLGKAWSSENGGCFYLVKVIDKDRVWVMPENSGSLEKWKFQSEPPGPVLTEESGGRKLKVEKAAKAQLHPACRITKQEYLLNGKTPIEEGKVAACEFLDLREEYDIINPAAVLEKVRSQPGREVDFVGPDLDAFLTNKIEYQFQPWGACTVRHECTVHRAFDLDYTGFIQTRVLARRPQDTLRYYIPGTLPFKRGETEYDFRSIQNFSSPPAAPLQFGVAEGNLESAERLPHRFIQLMERAGAGEKVDIGYAVGYSLLEGTTVPSVRASRCANALTIHTSAKTYPVALDKKAGRIVVGSVVDCLGYRQYFSPSLLSTNATACYWHRQGDIYVVYADYHKPLDREVLKLPTLLVGKKVTVVDTTPSIKLLSGGTVPDEGIALSVNGDYGYVVLALTDWKEVTAQH